MDREGLKERIRDIMERHDGLGSSLLSALSSIPSNPRKAAYASRFVLDSIIAAVINERHPGENIKIDSYLHSLAHPMFTSNVPPLVVPRIIFVQSMVGALSSSDAPKEPDLLSMLEGLVYVTEWFVNESEMNALSKHDGDVVEVLPQLRAQYKEYLRDDIVSVKFRQTASACYVQILSEENLGFIGGGANRKSVGDERMFRPERSIFENAHMFIHQLEEPDIAECIPLFTPSAVRDIMGEPAPVIEEEVFENNDA